ncbi:hypothetical protein NLX71_23965 [Paenibacillus sp. MZ04-78.2]|uniref:hypothetical protein n=1 Tax=Paenibacillus sp. MZ04-78.2 TaxID=2962034 RepID=UPI0020B7746D|nr:hypothetical protein [Paenibacillus sp. MZ04-78.2]MCP3776318.1 hypothetical protein [Paenibacillus sp. MZ04-78.2]
MIKRSAKVLLQFALVAVLTFSAVAVGNAAEKPELAKEEKKVAKSWRVTENGLVEIQEAEVQKLRDEASLNEQKRESAKRSFIANKYNYSPSENFQGLQACWGKTCEWDVYKQSGGYLALRSQLKKRVTPVVQNGGEAQFQVQEQYQYSLNLTLTGKIKDALDIAFDGSWSKATSYQRVLVVKAPEGKYAWFEFTPMMRNSYGVMEHWENSYYTNWKDKLRGTDFVDLWLTMMSEDFKTVFSNT